MRRSSRKDAKTLRNVKAESLIHISVGQRPTFPNPVIARSVATKQPSKVIARLRLGCFVLLRSPRNDGIFCPFCVFCGKNNRNLWFLRQKTPC